MKKLILSALAMIVIGMSAVRAESLYTTTQLDRSGTTYAAWLLSPLSNGQYIVQTAIVPSYRLSTESNWVNKTETHSNTLASFGPPTLAVSKKGDAVLFWIDVNPSTNLVAYYVKIRPAITSTWSNATIINAPGNVISDAVIHFNDKGQIIAVFSAFTDILGINSAKYITATTIASGNAWTVPVRITQ